MENFTSGKLKPLPSGEHPWAANLKKSRRLVGLVEFAATALITVYLFFGAGEQWSRSTMIQMQSPWSRAILFSALLALTYGVPAFPINFIRSYLIEKHYGLSTQSLAAWFSDQLKGSILGALIGLILVNGLTATLMFTGLHWWWIAALAAMFFGIVLTRLAPQLIVPLFFKMKPLDSPQLQDRFRQLAQRMGTPVLGIYEIDLSRRTKAANAAVIGFGATRRAVVGDTLLKEFTNDEVEFVLAHELAHHHYHDLWTGIVSNSFLTLVSFFIAHFAITHFEIFAVPFPPTTLNFNPIVLFWIAAISSVTSSVLAPLGKMFSRFAESRADRFAALATSHPEAGAAAFEKLGFQNIAVFNRPEWEEFLFYTHPAIARRIARLRVKNRQAT